MRAGLANSILVAPGSARAFIEKHGQWLCEQETVLLPPVASSRVCVPNGGRGAGATGAEKKPRSTAHSDLILGKLSARERSSLSWVEFSMWSIGNGAVLDIS